MQSKADAPEHIQTLIQLFPLGIGQESGTGHFIQRCRAEMTAGHPEQGVDITQSARTAFDIRLQVITGAVIAGVALFLLCQFGGKKAW